MRYVINDLARETIDAGDIKEEHVGKVLIDYRGYGHWHLLLGVRPEPDTAGVGLVCVGGIWEGLSHLSPVTIRRLPRCKACDELLQPMGTSWVTHASERAEDEVCDETGGRHVPDLARVRTIHFQPTVAVTVIDGQVADVTWDWSESRIDEDDDGAEDREPEAQVAMAYCDDHDWQNLITRTTRPIRRALA